MENNKTINIAIDEAKKSLADLINNTPLPFVIWEYILKEFAQEVSLGAKQQLQYDQQQLQETEKKED